MPIISIPALYSEMKKNIILILLTLTSISGATIYFVFQSLKQSPEDFVESSFKSLWLFKDKKMAHLFHPDDLEDFKQKFIEMDDKMKPENKKLKIVSKLESRVKSKKLSDIPANEFMNHFIDIGSNVYKVYNDIGYFNPSIKAIGYIKKGEIYYVLNQVSVDIKGEKLENIQLRILYRFFTLFKVNICIIYSVWFGIKN